MSTINHAAPETSPNLQEPLADAVASPTAPREEAQPAIAPGDMRADAGVASDAPEPAHTSDDGDRAMVAENEKVNGYENMERSDPDDSLRALIASPLVVAGEDPRQSEKIFE